MRISGPRAYEAVRALAGRLPEPRQASLATLRWRGELLDHALVLRFPGPASATGEDVAELHLHGGRAVVAAVLDALSGMAGLRAADPGEFTRRAFENGRIDLTEAEGLADLLSAETQSQRRAALNLAGGALRRRIEAWQGEILGLAAVLEAVLDFSDEGEVAEAMPLNFSGLLRSVAEDIQAYLVDRPAVERLRDGIRVVIAGPPNAGKSSLLNALAGREAAITSEAAGTTRDVIEAPVSIAGTPFLLIDTAGLRVAEEKVEAIGIAKAKATIHASDLILWLGSLEDAPRGSIVIHPKSDLAAPPQDAGSIAVSAKTGDGIGGLLRLLVEKGSELLPGAGEDAINERQRAALQRCAGHLQDGATTGDPLLAAESIRLSLKELDAVTGRAGVEEMLDALFGKFCIGK